MAKYKIKREEVYQQEYVLDIPDDVTGHDKLSYIQSDISAYFHEGKVIKEVYSIEKMED